MIIVENIFIPGEKKDTSGDFPVAIHDSNWPRGHAVLRDLPFHHDIPRGWLPEDFQQLLPERMRSDAPKQDLPVGLEDVSDGEFPQFMTPVRNEKVPPWLTRATEAEPDVVDLHGDEF